MLITLRQRLNKDFEAAYKSIKLPEVEEWFDIYFSRYLGYYLALASKRIGLSPNQVSLLSLFIGIISGCLFFFQEDPIIIAVGCLMLTLAGLLDSADGQLARMTGTVSDLGRKIDAIIDTFVFAACYIGGGFYFWIYGNYGLFEILFLGVLAGYLHSVKSSVYEFYKTEFLYYNLQSRDYRIPYLDEVKNTTLRGGFWNEALFILEKDYIGKQAYFAGRKRETRLKFEAWSQSDFQIKFREAYSKYCHRILTLWALVGGTNVHRTALMVFSLFGRLDWYFLFSIATFFPMMLVLRYQMKMDRHVIKEMEKAQE